VKWLVPRIINAALQLDSHTLIFFYARNIREAMKRGHNKEEFQLQLTTGKAICHSEI
jgi:hypothetical protein